MNKSVPVITIDGPSGSGKGTISQWLAWRLSWNLLDSGALYRILAFALTTQEVDLNSTSELMVLVGQLDVRFVSKGRGEPVEIVLNQQEVTRILRTEHIGNQASKIAALGSVREALLEWQRSFRQSPGLIADGRDMGTEIFKDAILKIFLSADPVERAKRRYQQLLEQNIDVKLAALVDEIAGRDARDRHRNISPLKCAEEAEMIDTTGLSIEEVEERVWALVKERVSTGSIGPL